MTDLKLPLLAPHDQTLQKCVYCPKLSRAACPVSNVEASETVTPWGKMSMAWFAARGDVPIDEEHAAPAWACSACYGCRERCDHKNEVATVLTDARAEMFIRGVAPEGARRLAGRFPRLTADAATAADTLSRRWRTGEGKSPAAASDPALLVGCGYLRWHPEVATSALRITEALLGRAPRLVGGCCGLPLLWAGDRAGFTEAGRAMLAQVGDGARVVVADPGCARAMMVEYPRIGVVAEPANSKPRHRDSAGDSKPRPRTSSGNSPRVELLLDLAAASSDIGPLADPPRVRWHDPCQLGRGLGRYDEPRALLRRLTGQPPEEFLYRRELASCSGAGGVLPSTRPRTSEQIADDRIAEHRQRGGGLLVTACAASLRRFQSRGEPAQDLLTLVARGLRLPLTK